MAEAIPSKHVDMQTKELRVHSQEGAPFSDDDWQMKEMNGKSLEWTPSILRKNSLLGFAAFYFCLLLGLAALAIVDTKRNGIATAKSTDHYLWTYGPTAVLAIAAALWGQVEHRTKQAIPWMLLQKKPTTASDTLLLDYVTVSQTKALFKSLYRAHWPVVVAIIGSLLIKLLTVASTGLLVLQNTQVVQQNCQLVPSDHFLHDFEPGAIGSSPLLSTLAINNGTLAYPPGTTADMAFQTLKMANHSEGSRNLQIEGVARAFQGDLDCETVTIRSYNSSCADPQDSNCSRVNLQIDIDSPSCPVTNMSYSRTCGNDYSNRTAEQCDFGDTLFVDCTQDGEDPKPPALVIVSGRALRRPDSTVISGDDDTSTDAYITAILSDQTAALVCYPKYSIRRMLVKSDSFGNLIGNASASFDLSSSSGSYSFSPNFTGWDLLNGLTASTQAAGIILDDAYSYYSGTAELWKSLEAFSNSTYTISELKNASILEEVSTKFFTMATAQMAKQRIMEPAEYRRISTGICYFTEPRLRVRGLSLYLMAASLVVKIGVALVMLYIAPRNVTPRDPATIGDLALILVGSPSLLDRLCHQGSSELGDIQAQLTGTKCQGKIQAVKGNHRFSVEIYTDGQHASGIEKATKKEDAKIKWWRPISIKPAFKVLVALSLILAVVALEILYWRSKKDNGLAQVDVQGYTRFVWVYVPAIVMLTAQTLTATIAFSTVFIFPFYILRTKYSSTRDVILREYVSKTAIQSLWQAAMNMHFPVLLMAATMLLAPLLTIVVSGLYTATPSELSQVVTLSTVNQFNSSFHANDLSFDSSYDAFKRASLNIGLLITQNYSYPAWTHDGLAFPAMEFQNASIQDRLAILDANEDSKLYTTLPAIQGDLSCSIVPGQPTNITEWLLDGEGTAFPEFDALGCDKWDIWPQPSVDAFGFFDIAHMVAHTDGNFGRNICGAYGTSITNWRAFTCNVSIQQVSTFVTLSATSLAVLDASIDTSVEPQLFSNQTFATNFTECFPTSMIPLIFDSVDSGEQENSTWYDPAFQALIYQSGITDDSDDFVMDDYMDDAGFEELAAGLTRVYRIVVSQTANLAIRVPFNASAPHAPAASFNATLTNPNVYRLIQSDVSTRILQCLLIILALCVGISFWAMDTRYLLPKNPASIAAGASLLAGNSEMLSAENLPREAQWWNKKELARRGVWQGYVFSLGWWGAGEQGPYGEKKRFGIDVGRADR